MPAAPVQDHIHLALTLGGSPDFAPLYEWKVQRRTEIPHVLISPARTLNGKLRKNVFKLSGSPKVFTDFRFTLTVNNNGEFEVRDRIDQLKNMVGKMVYFVDHYHPNSGEDHTGSIRTMLFARIGELTGFTQNLERYYVDIELMDGSLV